MNHHKVRFLFLNLGHFLDHLFMLIFASVAALRLSTEWGMTYATLIPYATPGFAAFGICAIPAGWLADRWSREGMMGVFFIGIGRNTREADVPEPAGVAVSRKAVPKLVAGNRLPRIFGVIIFTTAVGGLIFQGTTFALPKVFDERLPGLAPTATLVGWYASLVFSAAALAQLVIGYLVDHYSVRTVFASVALLQAAFFALMTQLSGIAALLVAFAFMFVVFGQIPINDVLVGRMARSEWRSRAYALRYIVTFSVMASTVPLIGWVQGEWGFSKLFGMLAVAALLIFVAVLLLPKSAVSLPQRPSSTA